MKASKFSDAQKAFILKQGTDGVPVAEICRVRRQIIWCDLATIFSPIVHHAFAFLHQIATPVGRFHLVANGMRQRHLRYVTGIICLLGGPIAERAAEAVRGQVVALHALQKCQEGIG